MTILSDKTSKATIHRDGKTEILDIPMSKPINLPFSENKIRHHDYYSDEPSLTDQSDLATSDINYIMAQYAKTGLLPVSDKIQGAYLDNTELPSLEQAFEMVNQASELFMQLPATVRKAMDNDPSQLENFISDDNNRDFLVKHGVLVQKEKEPKSPPESSAVPEPLKTKGKTEKTE